MPQPLIRLARSDDAEALCAIGAETFTETFGHLYPPRDLARFVTQAYDLDQARADLADPTKASWIVEFDSRVIGYASVGPCGLPHPKVTSECGELKRIYLLKPWQGGGLGARLFDEALGWLQTRGAPTIWIGVWSENHGAQRFYQRRGFSKVGEYGFCVGDTVDHEYILSRDEVNFSTSAAEAARNEHNIA